MSYLLSFLFWVSVAVLLSAAIPAVQGQTTATRSFVIRIPNTTWPECGQWIEGNITYITSSYSNTSAELDAFFNLTPNTNPPAVSHIYPPGWLIVSITGTRTVWMATSVAPTSYYFDSTVQIGNIVPFSTSLNSGGLNYDNVFYEELSVPDHINYYGWLFTVVSFQHGCESVGTYVCVINVFEGGDYDSSDSGGVATNLKDAGELGGNLTVGAIVATSSPASSSSSSSSSGLSLSSSASSSSSSSNSSSSTSALPRALLSSSSSPDFSSVDSTSPLTNTQLLLIVIIIPVGLLVLALTLVFCCIRRNVPKAVADRVAPTQGVEVADVQRHHEEPEKADDLYELVRRPLSP